MKFSALFRQNPPVLRETLLPVVSEMSELVTLAYQFVNLHLRRLWHRRKPFPAVNAAYLRAVLRTVAYTNPPKCDRGDKRIKARVLTFYNTHFQRYVRHPLPNDHRSHITTALADDMETAIQTNLKTRFEVYIRRWVNLAFKNTEWKRSLTAIKEAFLLNDSTKAPEPLRPYIAARLLELLPPGLPVGVRWKALLESDPLRFLRNAFAINAQLEAMHARTYAVIPQRTSHVPMHIPFDTSAMADLFFTSLSMGSGLADDGAPPVGRVQIHDHVNVYKPKIWELLTKKIPQWKGYSFHHMVRTDGYACSLCYVRDGVDTQQRGKKKKAAEKSAAAVEAPEFPRLDVMSKEQCDAILASNPFGILAADPGVNNPATICDVSGRILKYTNKRRQDENCNRPHQRWLEAEKRKHPPYAMDTDDDGAIRAQAYWNTRKKKKKKTRQQRQSQRRQQPPQPPLHLVPAPAPAVTPLSPVMAAEAKLSALSSRTLSSAGYKAYLQMSKEVDPELRAFYERPSKKMEKMRYRRFCKPARSDAKLVEEIKEKFLTEAQREELRTITDEKERRDKVVIVFGNWSHSTQMSGCRPSPGKGLRRMLNKHFRILTIWEGYTSQLYHRTHQRLSPAYKRDPSDPTSRIKIHEVLTLPGTPTNTVSS
jgi:hypothetical protein